MLIEAADGSWVKLEAVLAIVPSRCPQPTNDWKYQGHVLLSLPGQGDPVVVAVPELGGNTEEAIEMAKKYAKTLAEAANQPAH